MVVIIALPFLYPLFTGSGSAPSSQSKPAPTWKPAPTSVPKVGETIAASGWEVRLLDFGPYERFSPDRPPATKGQGKLVVADMRIRNLQNSTSNFTQNDFELKSSDGRTFRPAGQTASIDRGFVITQQVQPGLVTENRVVFDVDPAARGLTFTALKIQFSVPDL